MTVLLLIARGRPFGTRLPEGDPKLRSLLSSPLCGRQFFFPTVSPLAAEAVGKFVQARSIVGGSKSQQVLTTIIMIMIVIITTTTTMNIIYMLVTNIVTSEGLGFKDRGLSRPRNALRELKALELDRQIDTYIHTYLSLCIYIYIYTHTYTTHICVCIYIYIYASYM